MGGLEKGLTTGRMATRARRKLSSNSMVFQIVEGAGWLKA
jgi:hypothetical protein